MKTNFLNQIGFLVALLFFATFVTAQSGTSRITGTVLDVNGAAVEGARVTATNEATGVTLTQTSTSGGIYAFSSLEPGVYTVAVEQTGFKKSVKTGNVLEVGTPLSVDFALEIGAVTEVVTVQAAGETVQANTATIGNVVTRQAIENLPLNGRNPLTLVTLEPGVVQRRHQLRLQFIDHAHQHLRLW